MTASASSFKTVSVRAADSPKNDKPLAVTSSSFAEGQTIGMDFVFAGCGGKNQSPQLSWSGAPSDTKSFAITCFDPDAPTGSGYWHWLAFDIPASVGHVDAGAGTDRSPGGGTGRNDFGVSAYCGPCPPKGDHPHRYIFTVYALDTDSLGADDSTSGATTMFMMRGHILAQGSITGSFGH